MSESQKAEEKFNFDITPDYFKKINIYPTSIKLCLYAFFEL